MNTFKRYINAFIKALKMTIAGEALQPAEARYPNLSQWVSTGLQLAENTLKIADTDGMDEATRKTVMLKIDGRTLSMDVILRAVIHNMSLEYPMLMDTRIEHNLTTFYAINMNDQYRVSRLAEVDTLTPQVKSAIEALATHLSNIPSSKNP